jgi:hypothetical protein
LVIRLAQSAENRQITTFFAEVLAENSAAASLGESEQELIRGG